MLAYVLVAAGGLIGSVGRYWLSSYAQQLSAAAFPYGTLAVNVSGCFAIGLIASLSLERGLLSPNARLFLSVGLCGGFTTMSAFGYESMILLRSGSILWAFLNVTATVVACFAAVWLGETIGRLP